MGKRKDEYEDRDGNTRRESDPSTKAYKEMDERGHRKVKEILG